MGIAGITGDQFSVFGFIGIHCIVLPICQALQRSIVEDIWPQLKPGGIMVYSTCTFNTRENEENVRWIVEQLGADIVKIDTAADWGITGSLLAGWHEQVYRFIPGTTKGEGLFMAVLRKAADAEFHVGKKTKKGYSTAVAESRARQDAEQAFNTSQQSSEGAYMAPVQMDRNIITAALTVFRTSPIQYTRNCFYHARNLIRKRGKGTKESMINFRTGQYIADGLTEEQARQAAEKDYNKSVARDIVGMVVYGALLGILWRMVGSLPYLIAGDDDDEKKKILKNAVTGGAIVQPVTGLLGGGIVESAIDGYGNIADMFSPELPFTQDLKKAFDNIGNDQYAEAASQALSVMMQSATGFDPNTVADLITRTVTTLDSAAKLDAAQQAWQISGAVLSIPQSQYEQIMLDDLVKAGKGIDMSNTFGKRKFEPMYDKYLSDFTTNRMIRTAPLTWYLRSDEQAQKAEASAERRFRKLLKERGLNDLPDTK